MVDTPKEDDPDAITVADDGSVVVELPDEGAPVAAAEEQPKPVAERKRLKELPLATTQEVVADPQTLEVLQTSLARAEASQRASEAALAAERERTRQMQAATQRAQAEAAEAREAAENNQLVALNTSIDQASQELESLKADYARQMEAGEFAKIADTQARMAQTAAKLDRLQTQKDNFIPTAKRPAPAVAEPTPSLPLREQYLSQFDSPARSWLEAHPECLPEEVGGSAEANARMMAGHYAARAQHIVPNSPEYFRVIEEHTGHRKPEVAHPKPAPAAPAAPKPAPVQVSAPPSRELPTTSGTGLPRGTRTVKLTAEQKDMARISFPQLTEAQAYAQYARNMVELEAEGKLGRTTH